MKLVALEQVTRPACAPELAKAAAALNEGRLAIALREASAHAARSAAPPDVRLGALAIRGEALRRSGQLGGADQAFGDIVRLWGDGKETTATVARLEPDESRRLMRMGYVLNAVGEALFYEAEKARAAADAVKFPVYHGDRSREHVQKYVATKVKRWTEDKRAAIERAETAYLAITRLEPAPPPTWLTGAALRTGGLWAGFARELRSVVVPKEFEERGTLADGKTPRSEVLHLYRQALFDSTAPLVHKARGALEMCQRYAGRLQVRTAFVDACSAWLAHDPR